MNFESCLVRVFYDVMIVWKIGGRLSNFFLYHAIYASIPWLLFALFFWYLTYK